MPRKDAGGGAISAQAQQDLVSEGIENFELPKSLVTKTAKSAIPDNAKLQKETVLFLVKGSTVFINYLAATVHDVALSKQHKSISASDVLKALEMIEFGDLVDPLQNELQVYRHNAKEDKNRKTGVDRNSKPGKEKGKEVESTTPVVPLSVSHTTEDVNMSVPTGETEIVGEADGDYESEMADEANDRAEYDETEEGLMDVVAEESEELRRDAAGLDVGDPAED